MKFSTNRKGKGPVGKTVNHEGGEAFTLDKEQTLLNMSATCLMGEPKFYGKKGEIEGKIFKLANEVDVDYLQKLAVYLRSEMNLRSVPMFLMSVAAKRGGTNTRKYVTDTIQRADELYEMMACYGNIYGKPVPSRMKRGIADAFSKFDEYQFGKYNRKTDWTLKGVMQMTHPKEPDELLKKIKEGTLETPYTWEVELSSEGNKKETWVRLINSGRLPYMAMLRNLRNILKAGVEGDGIQKVISDLRDPNKVKRSRQFPFRFLSAYKELQNSELKRNWATGRTFIDRTTSVDSPYLSDILDALNDAVEVSAENIPKMKGVTLLACDVSGSMFTPISDRSKIQQVEIGLMLGTMAHKFTEGNIFGFFGNDWKVIPLSKSRAGPIENVEKLMSREGEVGYSTNGFKVIEYLNKNKINVNRVLIFTDCQLYGGSINSQWQEYRKNINGDARLYLFDLSGYGTSNFPKTDKNVTHVGGWNDSVLRFINEIEKNPQAQVNYIKSHY